MEISLYGSIAWRYPSGFGQAIEWARRHGWDSVDARGLSLDAPGDRALIRNAFGYDMLGPRNIQKSARQQLRAALDDAGVSLLGIYCSSPVNLPGETGDTHRQVFCEYLELAHDLGAPWVRSINNTLSTHQAEDMSESEAYERTVAGCRGVGPRAAALGVGLLLENNENTVTADAASLKRMKADVGDVCKVGITYDAVNAYFQGQDPEAGFHILEGEIDVLHVKNVRRHRDPRWDYMPRGDASYEWTGLADGDLDWASLIGRAKRGGFDGPIVFEYVNPFKGMPLAYWDQLREPEEAARVEAEFLRSVV
jgi:sugar phosphate isomerase/epimerase